MLLFHNLKCITCVLFVFFSHCMKDSFVKCARDMCKNYFNQLLKKKSANMLRYFFLISPAVDTDKPTASLPCPSKRNCSGQTQLQVAAMKGDLSLVKEHLRVWKCFNKRRVNLSDYAG